MTTPLFTNFPRTSPRPRRSGPVANQQAATRRPAPPAALRSLARLAPWLNLFITPLQMAAIGVLTTIQYMETFLEFMRWVQSTRTRPVTFSDCSSADVWDGLTQEYFEYLHELGALPATGSKLLAALLHLHPGFGVKIGVVFPRAARSLRGWHRQCPAQTRQPLPFLALCAIISFIITTLNRLDIGLCLLIGFSCYLRPREMSSLLVAQLVPPLAAGGLHFAKWGLILHPSELLIRSKTGHWDESILLDSPYLEWLPPFLEVLTRGRDPSAPLWNFTHELLIATLKQAAAATGVDILVPCYNSNS